MIKKSGQYGVPVITFDDQVVVGFDRAKIDSLLSQQKPPEAAAAHPSLGASVADAATIAAKLGSVPVFGAFVGNVKPGSTGERAGLQQGDIITELNLRPIKNADDLEKSVEGLTAGARVAIVFLRGNQTLRAETTM